MLNWLAAQAFSQFNFCTTFQISNIYRWAICDLALKWAPFTCSLSALAWWFETFNCLTKFLLVSVWFRRFVSWSIYEITSFLLTVMLARFWLWMPSGVKCCREQMKFNPSTPRWHTIVESMPSSRQVCIQISSRWMYHLKSESCLHCQILPILCKNFLYIDVAHTLQTNCYRGCHLWISNFAETLMFFIVWRRRPFHFGILKIC